MLQAFNILRYEIGQKYDSHYDAFNPAEYGPQKSQRVCMHHCNLNYIMSLVTTFWLFDASNFVSNMNG